MEFIKPKFTLMNKIYIGQVKCNNLIDIYNHYQLNYLSYLFPQELIEKIMSFICTSLIVAYCDNNIQYINPIDNKIIKEIKLKQYINDYDEMRISNDGLVLIVTKYNTINIEYLGKDIVYSYTINNEIIEEYDFNIMGHIIISPSTKYFIKCNKENEKCNVGLYDTITGNNITFYSFTAKYISNVCFSPDETKLAVLITTNNQDDDFDYNIDIINIINHQILHKNIIADIDTFLSWSPDSKILCTSMRTNGTHYTNATYNKLIKFEETKFTEEIIDTIPYYINSVKWKNNDTICYLNDKFYTYDIKTNNMHEQYNNIYRDINIVEFDYIEDQFIGLYENNFGDTMIVIV